MFIQYTLKLNSKQYLWIFYTVILIIDLLHYCAISILLQGMIAIASIKVDVLLIMMISVLMTLSGSCLKPETVGSLNLLMTTRLVV